MPALLLQAARSPNGPHWRHFDYLRRFRQRRRRFLFGTAGGAGGVRGGLKCGGAAPRFSHSRSPVSPRPFITAVMVLTLSAPGAARLRAGEPNDKAARLLEPLTKRP